MQLENGSLGIKKKSDLIFQRTTTFALHHLSPYWKQTSAANAFGIFSIVSKVSQWLMSNSHLANT